MAPGCNAVNSFLSIATQVWPDTVFGVLCLRVPKRGPDEQQSRTSDSSRSDFFAQIWSSRA